MEAKLIDYLQHHMRMEELVAWAVQAMIEGEFDSSNFETLSDIISHLGHPAVREFGLIWKDCEEFLLRDGYQVQIEVLEVD